MSKDRLLQEQNESHEARLQAIIRRADEDQRKAAAREEALKREMEARDEASKREIAARDEASKREMAALNEELRIVREQLVRDNATVANYV